MMKALKPVLIGAAAVTLAGCSPFGQSAPPPAAAVSAAPAGPPPTPTTVDPSMLGGVLAGSVGAGLEDSDRRAAYEAQTTALETGQRHSWKGQRGVFGYVEVGVAQGSCKPFTQTVFIAGRPYTGRGKACRQSDGSWQTAG